MSDRDDAATVAEQFEEAAQQREADFLGMWLFLASEVMMFGGLFMGMAVYHLTAAEGVREAAHHLYMWIGGGNTAILLTSSLTMALAVLEARDGRCRRCCLYLALTALLGSVFLGIKGWEYYLDYHEGLMPGVGPPFPLHKPGAEVFVNLYFVATGLHALHVIGGVVLLALLALRVGRGALALPEHHIGVEMPGLYWHFVDVVWIFLYPALYLVGR